MIVTLLCEIDLLPDKVICVSFAVFAGWAVAVVVFSVADLGVTKAADAGCLLFITMNFEVAVGFFCEVKGLPAAIGIALEVVVDDKVAARGFCKAKIGGVFVDGLAGCAELIERALRGDLAVFDGGGACAQEAFSDDEEASVDLLGFVQIFGHRKDRLCAFYAVFLDTIEIFHLALAVDGNHRVVAALPFFCRVFTSPNGDKATPFINGLDFDGICFDRNFFTCSGANAVFDDLGFTEHFVEEVPFFCVVGGFAFGGMGDLADLAVDGSCVVCVIFADLEADIDIIELHGFEEAERVTFGMGFEDDLFARKFGGAVAVEQKPAKEQAEPGDASQSLSGFGGVGDRWRGCG